MAGILLFAFFFLLSCFFAGRFYLLKRALKETEKELQEIQRDLTQNQVLHLPLPDHDLEGLMKSINSTLDEVRNERREYAKRESEFQAQIEAISHDLRTPLTVILGYLGFLQKQGDLLTEEQQEILGVIKRKTRSMEKLISQFYDYSRLTAGDYELKTEDMDAGKVLREVLADNCLMLEEAQLEVRTDFPDHPVWAEGERAALERVFSNLFQNAGRYASRFLRLSIKPGNRVIQVIFENDTKQVKEEDITHFFERFYRKDASRNQEGTGLGLTTAKLLAEEMNGNLTVELLQDREQAAPVLRFTLSLRGAGAR